MTKAIVNWQEASKHTKEVCDEHLTRHFNEITRADGRLSKRIKEAFFGKNIWSHHKVRLARQVAGVVWDVAKHAVPAGDVADKVRQAVDEAGKAYVNQQIGAGAAVSTELKDFFGVSATTIHFRMETLFEHLESIALWQREFEATMVKFEAKVAQGQGSPKEQIYLISSYIKLLDHYRDALAVSLELKRLFEAERAKIQMYLHRWLPDPSAPGKLPEIYDAENVLVAAVLFNPHVHEKRCSAGPGPCYAGSDPAARALFFGSFYADFLSGPPIDPASFPLLTQTYINEAGFAQLMAPQSFQWFAARRAAATAAEYAVPTARTDPATEVITPEAWRSLMRVAGVGILKGTYLTKQNFEALKRNNWFASQQTRIGVQKVTELTNPLNLGSTAMSKADWESFSAIWGFRGDETQGVDTNYALYVKCVAEQLGQFSSLSEGQSLDASQRTRFTELIVKRTTALDNAADQTMRFINAKSANAKSQRRPFIQMLDTLLQREAIELAKTGATVSGAGEATPGLDAAITSYRNLLTAQAAELISKALVDPRDVGAKLETRAKLLELLTQRSNALDKLAAATKTYIGQAAANPTAARTTYALMLDALVSKEQAMLVTVSNSIAMRGAGARP